MDFKLLTELFEAISKMDTSEQENLIYYAKGLVDGRSKDTSGTSESVCPNERM